MTTSASRRSEVGLAGAVGLGLAGGVISLLAFFGLLGLGFLFFVWELCGK
jgi:hypothetical protein